MNLFCYKLYVNLLRKVGNEVNKHSKSNTGMSYIYYFGTKRMDNEVYARILYNIN